jgi:hydrogenase-4 component B
MATSLHVLMALGGLTVGLLGFTGWMGDARALDVPWLVPLSGLSLRMDPLGGFFLLLVGATTVPSSIYAIG